VSTGALWLTTISGRMGGRVGQESVHPGVKNGLRDQIPFACRCSQDEGENLARSRLDYPVRCCFRTFSCGTVLVFLAVESSENIATIILSESTKICC